MSNYPKWWDTTITVYNKVVDEETDIIRWYRTVLHDCFWKYSGNKMIFGDTVLETNAIICRIPKNSKYLPRHEWESLPNEDMGNYFTLGVEDIIVCGEATEDINEYVSGKRSSDVIQRYKKLQGCMIVNVVSDYSGVGRNNPHYYAKGI